MAGPADGSRELDDITGGRELGAVSGKHSPVLEWKNLIELNPELLAVVPYGYSINETLFIVKTLTKHKVWEQPEAVKNEKVYISAGNRFVNLPGPILLDSAEIFAEILYPDIFKAKHLNTGWLPFQPH